MTGKAEPNGTSIVDVTDPANPKYLRHLPGQPGTYEAGGAQMVRVCDGSQLPQGAGAVDRSAVHMLRTFGGEAHEIWNVADPANPLLVTRLGGSRTRTRAGGNAIPALPPRLGRARLAHQAHDAGLRSFRPRPSGEDPRLRPAGPAAGRHRRRADRAPWADLDRSAGQPRLFRLRHQQGRGPADRRSREIAEGTQGATPESLRLPVVAELAMSSWNGAHTTFPMPKLPIAEFARDKDGAVRDIVMIVDEAILNECQEARQMVWFADVSIESRPMMISNWTVSEASGNFCQRGGRFGAHSSNESMDPVYYKKMAFIAFFNAGVRALDVRDPFQPKEVGYFIRPSPTRPTSVA